MLTKKEQRILKDWDKHMFKRGYQAGYRAGTNHGKTKAINTCMALGRQTGQPKGYYKALGEVIDNLEYNHKIGFPRLSEQMGINKNE